MAESWLLPWADARGDPVLVLGCACRYMYMIVHVVGGPRARHDQHCGERPHRRALATRARLQLGLKPTAAFSFSAILVLGCRPLRTRLLVPKVRADQRRRQTALTYSMASNSVAHSAAVLVGGAAIGAALALTLRPYYSSTARALEQRARQAEERGVRRWATGTCAH